METGLIRGLIPAAGLSRRMGAFKPLLPFRGRTVIEASAASLLDGGAASVTVVTGFRAEEIEAVLSAAFPGRVDFIRNPDYAESDMLRSVQLGCEALPNCDAFFLLPGDIPAVSSATVRSLCAARPEEGPYILFPVLDGRRGHPPLIHAALRGAIRDHRGGDGLRGLWNERRELIRTIDVDDGGVHADLDTPADYQAILETNGRS